MHKVIIIGGGLAGSECAWQLAKRGIEVEIFEQRNDQTKTFAHRTADLAELVCSNSLRSNDPLTAIGILHHELSKLDSLVMMSANQNRIPAGSALAVDREGFSKFIEHQLLSTKKVVITRKEITNLPLNSNQPIVIATGPLTSDALSQEILKITGQQHLAFFDAIAPIIFKDSIDFSIAWMQSRYDKGNGNDYINCPLTKQQYFDLVEKINNSEKTEFKQWEKDTKYFDGCLPIEIMAQRGIEVLRYGPLKPVGLTNPHYPLSPKETKLIDRKEKPYAVVQLRQDNALGTLYNMVGFQTKMKYGDQQKIFRNIPGLQNAEFARFGGIHRNTFINSPMLLDNFLRLKTNENLYFAGQITGVEGYVESASMGLLTGIFIAHQFANKLSDQLLPPNTTAIGSLLNYITKDKNQFIKSRINQQNNFKDIDYMQEQELKNLENNSDNSFNDFQPMNVNFGLFMELAKDIKKDQRKQAYSDRAFNDLELWKKSISI